MKENINHLNKECEKLFRIIADYAPLLTCTGIVILFMGIALKACCN